MENRRMPNTHENPQETSWPKWYELKSAAFWPSGGQICQDMSCVQVGRWQSIGILGYPMVSSIPISGRIWWKRMKKNFNGQQATAKQPCLAESEKHRRMARTGCSWPAITAATGSSHNDMDMPGVYANSDSNSPSCHIPVHTSIRNCSIHLAAQSIPQPLKNPRSCEIMWDHVRSWIWDSNRVIFTVLQHQHRGILSCDLILRCHLAYATTCDNMRQQHIWSPHLVSQIEIPTQRPLMWTKVLLDNVDAGWASEVSLQTFKFNHDRHDLMHMRTKNTFCETWWLDVIGVGAETWQSCIRATTESSLTPRNVVWASEVWKYRDSPGWSEESPVKITELFGISPSSGAV